MEAARQAELRVMAPEARDAARFIAPIGRAVWTRRLAALRAGCAPRYAGPAMARRHALEFTVEKLARARAGEPLSAPERRVGVLLRELVALRAGLGQAGRVRWDSRLAEACAGEANLTPLFHLAHVAMLQRGRGFAVRFAALEDGAPFDLLLRREDAEAELVCDVVSAESGRDLHRGAWVRLIDRIDPDLQGWLAAHPGRYLLKMTLPRGLKRDGSADGDDATLAELHRRITRLLSQQRRADHDEAAVLRLDPLLLAGAQADELGLMPRLRREFGPEAHLAVTEAGGGVMVMAARASREDEVAEAVHRRMAEIAPVRFSGERPGILAMFVEDTDRPEWRRLCETLRLEGEARQFLTRPEAKTVVAVTCASRVELLGEGGPEGELRFRNPAHAAARCAKLAPSIVSSA